MTRTALPPAADVFRKTLHSTPDLVRKRASGEALCELEQRSATAGTWRFTISTETRDLQGDIVVQAGREDVSERIPAQLDHSGSMRDLVGSWANIQTRGTRTTAELQLFDKGLSRAADMVRALLEAGVRLAASIGFVSVKRDWIREPDTEEGRITGIRFLRWKLLEASVVVVPANPEALSHAKRLLPPSAHAELDQLVRRAVAPPPARTAAAPASAPLRRGHTMNVAERIAEVRRQLLEQRNALNGARERLANATEDDEAELETAVDEAQQDVQRSERHLTLLGGLEEDLAQRAQPARSAQRANLVVQRATSADGGDVTDVIARPVRERASGAPALLRRRTQQEVSPADLLVRSAVCAMYAHVLNIPVEQAIEMRYGDHEETRAVATIVTRAAQNPAMTNVPGWAQELVQESFEAFMTLLATANPIIPRLPLQRFQFDQYGKITVPSRARQTNPNLAAAFRAEGAPIRVGGLQLQSAVLTPKSMGVIGSFTNELFQRSNPNIETIIRESMIEDTNEVLDGVFLDANPAVAGIRPAGIQNGVAAPNTAPSTGVTAAQIDADLTARAAQMITSRYGRRAVWIMNEVRWLKIRSLQNAVGTLLYPETANGTLKGYPVYTSIDVPSDVVMLVDCSVLVFAGGSPQFAGTDVATLHEEDTTPLPIVDNAGTPVVAHPVRSLFQTNSSALRSIWEVDWAVVPGNNSGAVQTITGVAW